MSKSRIEEYLSTLKWTHNKLFIEANIVARRMLIEESQELYPDDKKEREQYVNDGMKPSKREDGKYNTRVLTRATLYNIIHGKHLVSEDKALLVKTAINNGMKRAGYKVDVSYDDLGIQLYTR